VSYEELTAFFTEGKTAKKLGEFSEILSIIMSAPSAPSSPQSRPFSGSTFPGGTMCLGWLQDERESV
jgi:hypothetical protein